MTTPLGVKLLRLNLLYSSHRRKSPGWEHAYTEELMHIVLNHHNIKFIPEDLHRTFITWAPHLFVEDIS
jgi:hypothetical protein